MTLELPVNLQILPLRAEHMIMASTIASTFLFWAVTLAPSQEFLTPPVGPLAPGEARATFKTQHGLVVDLMASEPDVVDPVCAAFDERGRMFVAEMRGYPNKGVGTGEISSGTIRMLEDTNADGLYDKATMFAKGLRFPMGILPWRGGVIVAVAPDIIYLKDTNGDGVADERKVLLTGFILPNIQQLVNTLCLDLDGRVRIMVGGTGGTLFCPEKPDFKLELRGRACSFNPDKPWEMEAVTGGGQYGLAHDAAGHWFTNTNSQHLRFLALEDRVVRRNPALVPPPLTVDIPDHGAATKLFRISAFEPWRVERTGRRAGSPDAKRFPTTELVAGGFTTSACSPAFFEGPAFSQTLQGSVITCDPANNLIHRDIIEPSGSGFVARHADADCEILASKDNFFRPVHLSVGPDGGMVVCDFYREAIETPLSLPEDILKRLRLETAGRGRIWRLRDANFKPQLVKAPETVDGLVAWLADPNPWRRTTAQRLLIERTDPSTPAAITKSLKADLPWVGWIHGLWTLDRLSALDESQLRKALNHARPEVREQAAILVGGSSDRARAMAAELAVVATDASPRVRLQAVAAMGASGRPVPELVAAALERDAADPWISLAALSVAIQDHGQILEAWVKLTGGKVPGPATRDGIGRLAIQAGAGTTAERTAFLKSWARLPESWQAPALVNLARGMRRAGTTLADMDKTDNMYAKTALSTVRARLERAMKQSTNSALPLTDRLDNLALALLSPDEPTAEVLGDWLSARSPVELQTAAIQGLATRSFNANTVGSVVGSLKSLSAAGRREAELYLVGSALGRNALLTAFERGDVPQGLLESSTRLRLAKHATETNKSELAAKLTSGSTTRVKVLEAYKTAITPTQPADAEKGRLVFRKNCATCHRLENHGHTVGPDLLAALKGKDKATLLVAILDPNREIDARYVNQLVTLKTGRTTTGLTSVETASSLTLRRAEAVEEVLLRGQIDQVEATGQSLMPEGLEKEIPPASMADLLAYLLQQGG